MLDREGFSARRAIERLRDGLFEREAVERLTVEEEAVTSAFTKGLRSIERGQAAHLCLSGSYGRGKSHTLAYLNRQALSRGYATSLFQLDLREIPLHHFSAVYRAMMSRLALPDGRPFIEAWKQDADREGFSEALEGMPYRFRMVLEALRASNGRPPLKGRSSKRAGEESSLERALLGGPLPVSHLKKLCKERRVEGDRGRSLICRGNAPYVEMVQAMARLLRAMGYRGLLLFFDEAESLAELRLKQRAKGYEVLDRLLCSSDPLYLVLACTDHLFERVRSEPYGDERAIFGKNYAEAWKELNVVCLREFSSGDWEALLERLIQLYRRAYRVDLPVRIGETLQRMLSGFEGQEIRFKIKAAVNRLDIEAQRLVLSP